MMLVVRILRIVVLHKVRMPPSAAAARLHILIRQTRYLALIDTIGAQRKMVWWSLCVRVDPVNDLVGVDLVGVIIPIRLKPKDVAGHDLEMMVLHRAVIRLLSQVVCRIGRLIILYPLITAQPGNATPHA